MVGAAAVVRTVAETVEGIENFQQGLGDFIQNGPDDGILGHVRDQYRRRCEQYSNVPDWLLALSPIARRTFGNMCDPYLGDGGFDPPVNEPPFQGGQCADVYTINYTLNPENEGQTTGFLQARGPIAGIRREQAPSGAWISTLGCHGLVLSGSENCRSISDQGFAYRVVGGANPTGQGSGPRINSITPCGADDCGDPAPEIRPGPNPAPEPPDDGQPDPTDNPEDPTDPIVPIIPFVDPRWGPIDLPFGGGGGGSGGPVPPQVNPGDSANVGSPIDGGPGTPNDDGEVDFGNPPSGRAWVGCIVELLPSPPLATIPSAALGSDVYPRVVGNAALRHGSQRGTATQIRSKWSAHFRESEALEVDGVLVGALPSVSYRVYPVSLEICPEDKCSAEPVSV